MSTRGTFFENLVPKLSAEHDELYAMVVAREYAIADLIGVFGWDNKNVGRESVKRFVASIIGNRPAEPGRKRRFNLHEVLSIHLCWSLKRKLNVRNDLLADVFERLNPAEVDSQIDLDLRNLEDEEIAALPFESKDMRRHAYHVFRLLYPIIDVLVEPETSPVFLHIVPPNETYKQPRCRFMKAEDLAHEINTDLEYKLTPGLEAFLHINATAGVATALESLRERAGADVGKLPLVSPPANLWPDNPAEIEVQLVLTELETSLIRIVRSLRNPTKMEISVRDRRPQKLEYDVFHPARDVRPGALLEDPNTLSVTSIPNKKTRHIQGYIQRLKIDFTSAADDRKDGPEPIESQSDD